MPSLREWESFYVITGSSAAALTGLMFVVVTLAAERTTRHTGGLRAFATPTIVHLCAVLLLAGIATTPGHSVGSLRLCLGGTALAGLGYMGVVFLRMRRQTDYEPVASDHLWHAVLPALAYLLLLASALTVRAHGEVALRLAAVFTLGLLFVGIHNAWDAAVWITTERPSD